ncbi:hypothetical protein CEXT_787671 [Caerostris extrusa]|uniref:Uncharacterized protein n=1 Tax=Caerostris extrusa TaxID=172846 RepID=A0AAV4NUT4_CAEEX|nr:hypothetical protein CEXT_787671 [Caerostris extrusa]
MVKTKNCKPFCPGGRRSEEQFILAIWFLCSRVYWRGNLATGYDPWQATLSPVLIVLICVVIVLILVVIAIIIIVKARGRTDSEKDKSKHGTDK